MKKHAENLASEFQPLRRRLYAIVLAYLVIVALIALAGLLAVRHSDYLLQRAGASYQQLQALSRLNSAIQHHFNRQLESLTHGAPTPALNASVEAVEAGFAELRQLAAAEVDLIRNHAEKAAEGEEIERLEQIHSELNQLLELALGSYQNAPVWERQAALLYFTRTLLERFEQRVTPLLDEALADERAEVAVVERELGLLGTRLQWATLGGVVVSVFAAALFVWSIGQALLRPVSVLARTRDELYASNQRLLAIDRNRRRFLEDIGHELRSPVTIVMGEADVTLRDREAGTAECRTALERIRAHTDYLFRRVEELIRLARAEDGELKLRQDPVDLGLLIEDTLSDLEAFADINRVTLEAEINAGRIEIIGDALWLKQLLLTLLDNAIKFSPDQGVVSVSLVPDNELARIRVSDQGPGIAAEQLPYLFERYYQAEAGERSGKGHGLGMAIASWIVGQHGGAIAAHSVKGDGTEIDIRLPVSRVEK